MSKSVESDEMAHDEPSYLYLCCLQKPIFDCGSAERANSINSYFKVSLLKSKTKNKDFTQMVKF